MKYRITEAAQKKAESLVPVPKDPVVYMAEFSAPITHRFGSRRYEGYILRVRGSLIIDINLATAGENGKPVPVICGICEGDGEHCLPCHSTGYKYV